MNKARPFKFLRNHTAKAWISPLVMGAFLFSVLMCCMCGPYCASTGAADPADVSAQVASECCSSHAPVQEMPSTSRCCKHESGETHCEDDLSENALQLTDSTISFTVPSAALIEIILPEPSKVTVHEERAAQLIAAPIAPAYIQFQSFLI